MDVDLIACHILGVTDGSTNLFALYSSCAANASFNAEFSVRCVSGGQMIPVLLASGGWGGGVGFEFF